MVKLNLKFDGYSAAKEHEDSAFAAKQAAEQKKAKRLEWKANYKARWICIGLAKGLSTILSFVVGVCIGIYVYKSQYAGFEKMAIEKNSMGYVVIFDVACLLFAIAVMHFADAGFSKLLAKLSPPVLNEEEDRALRYRESTVLKQYSALQAVAASMEKQKKTEAQAHICIMAIMSLLNSNTAYECSLAITPEVKDGEDLCITVDFDTRVITSTICA